MVKVIENLLGKPVDLDDAQMPTTVQAEGRRRVVVAAAFMPPREGELSAHLVVYNRNRSAALPVSPTDRDWAVSVLVHDDEAQRSYLAHGDYDLTFAEAMERFVRRIERQG
jgi:hypothetical protein